MPELPDVAGFKSYLDANALHQRIERTSVADGRILEEVTGAKLARELKDASLEKTRRHGKFLFAAASSGTWLVLHFGMTGSLRCGRGRGAEADDDHAVLVLHFRNDGRLIYRCRRLLGRVSLTTDVGRFIAAHGLGPDALDRELKPDRLAALLAGRRGALKSTLMNQSIVAGLGNVYTDELLFQCRLHPATHVDELDAEEIEHLCKVMKRMLRTAARHGGDLGELSRSWMLPRRDDQGDCPRCGSDLESLKISGRTAWYCPRCQRRP